MQKGTRSGSAFQKGAWYGKSDGVILGDIIAPPAEGHRADIEHGTLWGIEPHRPAADMNDN